MRAVFEAVAHRSPYPKEQFAENRWNHMVLKALFVGSTLHPIQGLDERANPTLARMLCDYAHERWAAGRPVSPELWRCVGPHADAEALADLQRVLATGGAIERQAAALALARLPRRQGPRAARLRRPDLAAAVEARQAYLGQSEPGSSERGAPARSGAARETEHDVHRPAHPHDLAHDQRLRGDGQGRRGRADRAGVLDRPAADLCRHLHRLPLDHRRLGALSRRPVRHPPLLHDRPELQGGQQRGAGRGRDGDPAALRAQGGRRRDRRDRLRRADRARGQVLPAAAGARQGAGAAGDDPHAASRQEARHDPLDGRDRGARPAADPGGDRPQQRGDRARGARSRLLGGVLDLSEHQDGQRAHGRDRAPVRRRSG